MSDQPKPGDLIEWQDGRVTNTAVVQSVNGRVCYITASRYVLTADITRNYGPAETTHDDGEVTRVMTLPVRGVPAIVDRVVSLLACEPHADPDESDGFITLRPAEPERDPNVEAIAQAIYSGQMTDQPRAEAIEISSRCRWLPAWCYPNHDRYSQDRWYPNRDGKFPAGVSPGTHELGPVRERVEELRAEGGES